MSSRVPPPARPSTPAHAYDHLAARYDRLAELLDGPLQDWLHTHLPRRRPGRWTPDTRPPGRDSGGPRPGGRALDLGCGTGQHAQLLADHYDEVLAVDHSTAMLQHARRRRHRPAITYQHRDLRHVTVERDGRFDLVLVSRVLHELDGVDVDGVLGDVRRLVRPGGRLLLVDLLDVRHPHQPSATDRSAGHGWPPRAAGWDRPAGHSRAAVDPRPVPRELVRAAAWRCWSADVRHRRRPVGERIELLRLLLDPDRLDHLAATRLWPAAQWHRRCLSAFPAAAVTVLRARPGTGTTPPGPARRRPPRPPSFPDPPFATHALAWTAPEFP